MASPVHQSVIVITADQVGSRSAADAVPEALAAMSHLARGGDSRMFVRTAGDEIQALLTRAVEAVEALEILARLGVWRAGIGVGPVRHPVPDDVRAATGAAFVAAREAVDASRTTAGTMAVRVAGSSSPSSREDVVDAASRLEAAVALLQCAWRRRSSAGWQVAQLLESGGRSQRQIAAELGVTPSAVSQRVRAAAVEECLAGKALAVWLLDDVRARLDDGLRG